VTIGSFTVADSNASGSGSCTDIYVKNNSTTQTAYGNLYVQGYYDNGYELSPTAAEPVNTAGDFLNPLQFAEYDGSSMITGIVGNETGAQQFNGIYPCINVGGVAGS
jgi:hypothetical protein